MQLSNYMSKMGRNSRLFTTTCRTSAAIGVQVATQTHTCKFFENCLGWLQIDVTWEMGRNPILLTIFDILFNPTA